MIAASRSDAVMAGEREDASSSGPGREIAAAIAERSASMTSIWASESRLKELIVERAEGCSR